MGWYIIKDGGTRGHWSLVWKSGRPIRCVYPPRDVYPDFGINRDSEFEQAKTDLESFSTMVRREGNKLRFKEQSQKGLSPARTIGTMEYFKYQSWNNISFRRLQVRYRDVKVEFDKEQFYCFCENNKKTIEALYSLGETPSIDRIDTFGHYSLDNIRIISHRDNSRRRWLESDLNSKL